MFGPKVNQSATLAELRNDIHSFSLFIDVANTALNVRLTQVSVKFSLTYVVKLHILDAEAKNCTFDFLKALRFFIIFNHCIKRTCQQKGTFEKS